MEPLCQFMNIVDSRLSILTELYLFTLYLSLNPFRVYFFHYWNQNKMKHCVFFRLLLWTNKKKYGHVGFILFRGNNYTNSFLMIRHVFTTVSGQFHSHQFKQTRTSLPSAWFQPANFPSCRFSDRDNAPPACVIKLLKESRTHGKPTTTQDVRQQQQGTPLHVHACWCTPATRA